MTLMTFDKLSNDRRTAVEPKSDRSCNYRMRNWLTIIIFFCPRYQGSRGVWKKIGRKLSDWPLLRAVLKHKGIV